MDYEFLADAIGVTCVSTLVIDVSVRSSDVLRAFKIGQASISHDTQPTSGMHV